MHLFHNFSMCYEVTAKVIYLIEININEIIVPLYTYDTWSIFIVDNK